MIRLLREFRLIPIVVLATGCLFALKVIGLLLDGGYLLSPRTLKSEGVVALSLNSSSQELIPQTVPLEGPPRSSWMREIFGYPDVTGAINHGNTPERPPRNSVAITGSTPAPKPEAKEAPPDKAAAPPKPPPVNGTVIQLDPNSMRTVSQAERAILERLQERRQELDARARELDIRESMLKEAEKKLEDRANEIKTLEAKANTGVQKKAEAEASRFKNLATMYENMKPKDAAKIFDRLELKVLIEMSSQINPRRMSEILAQMSPDTAERLTTELASRANGNQGSANPASLPKIEGRPNGS